jgi:CheY-like chemotaxis protein/HPt (histidine-containing phosphotransfer) domain-containing protein
VPFTQFSGASVGSTGLGLAICQRICRMMGGDIAVESTFGRGSTFTVSVLCGLPAAAGRAAATRTPDVAEARTLQSTSETGAWLLSGHMQREVMTRHAGMAHEMPLTVLLADDYEVNRMVQHAQLEQLGYRTDAVANGEEVLRALHARPYDVVLMDIRMPVMDGLEATRLIRGRSDGRQPFIVAVTASAQSGDQQKFVAAGMDAFISKPVVLGELAAVLERAFLAKNQGKPATVPDDMIEIDPVTLELEPLYSSLGSLADGLLQKVIPVFLRELPGRELALKEAFRRGDAQALAQVCHGLKGASRSIGGTEFANECERCEQRGYAGELPRASELESLLDLGRRTGRALAARLKGLNAVQRAG